MREAMPPSSSSTHWSLTSDHRFSPVRAAAMPPNHHHPRSNPGNYCPQQPDPSSPSHVHLKVVNNYPRLQTTSDHQQHQQHHRHQLSSGGSRLTPATMAVSSSTPAAASSYALWRHGGKNNKNSSTHVDVKRKQRIAAYKAYAVESKIKASVRNGLRWMKNKYTYMVHGY